MSNNGMVMDNPYENMWKELEVPQFEVLPQYLLGDAEERCEEHENSWSPH